MDLSESAREDGLEDYERYRLTALESILSSMPNTLHNNQLADLDKRLCKHLCDINPRG